MIVIAKEPVAGRVKTRLVPPLTFEQAASVAVAALTDTLEVASTVPATTHLLALSGSVGPWLPAGWTVTAQRGRGLDVRLGGAFNDARGPSLLIGMDTPQVRPDQLTAFDPSSYDACLGLAPDGGYWAIGFADHTRAADLIKDVPMSTEWTGRTQLRRLRDAGLRVQLLDEVTDIDTIDVAREVAAAHPHTRFGQELRQLDRRIA